MINKRLIRIIGTFIFELGFDPRKLYRSILGIPLFFKNSYKLFIIKRRGSTKDFKIVLAPILSDATSNSGVAKGHYFHQDLWAARRIFEMKPRLHVDVGSRIDGFIAHLLSFSEVTVVDVRPLVSKVPGLTFIQRDMMANDGSEGLKSDSVSCLHALEHFGLGRYGDPLDWNGWHKGLVNLAEILTHKGHLYLSVPIGAQVVEFNAHRIFEPSTIINAATELGLQLEDFSFIDDRGDFHKSEKISEANDCTFGCGCFEFIKP